MISRFIDYVFSRRILQVFVFLLVAVAASPSSVADTRLMDFDVFLDGEPMGSHRYTLQTLGERIKVTSEARYRVKVLFVTAWQYMHRSEETWVRGCLQSISSTTNENGRDFQVHGRTSAAGLELETRDGPMVHSGCVRTFAYWDPALLDTPRLMNAQTGKISAVTVTTTESRSGQEPVGAKRGHTSEGTTRAVAVRGDDIHLDLSYDPTGEWLSLTSLTKEGRSIEYRRRSAPAE